MKKYNTTKEALTAHKSQLERTSLKEITSWTTLDEEKVWKELNDLCEQGRLYVQERFSNMEMRLLFLPE